jgi:hypothetical protein
LPVAYQQVDPPTRIYPTSRDVPETPSLLAGRPAAARCLVRVVADALHIGHSVLVATDDQGHCAVRPRMPVSHVKSARVALPGRTTITADGQRGKRDDDVTTDSM